MDRRVRPCWIAILLMAAGCGSNAPARNPPARTSLTIGLGGGASASAGDDSGLNAIIANLVTESLVLIEDNGRPKPGLIDQWAFSADGLSLTLQLREAVFHDDAAVTADVVKSILGTRLPRLLGSGQDAIVNFRVDSPRQLTLLLSRRSNFVVEALNLPFLKPGTRTIGTGAFEVASPDAPTHLVANTSYTGGAPGLGSVDMKRYDSIRSAWAELLRGNVDMLYEVGVDALDSLEPSSKVRVFSYRRHYQLAGIFNTRSKLLQDLGTRRKLAASIDRDKLIQEAFAGRGVASSGPIWPEHWAIPPGLSALPYEPTRLADDGKSIVLRCLVADAAYERVAIALQRQLQSVGINLNLDMPSTGEAVRRLESGDFDLALVEVISAPNLLRPSLFWTSKGPYNYGGYHSAEVDAAFAAIDRAADDDAYRKGVADLQQAITADPPAIFLAWTERARAVSTDFQVPVEPGRDPLGTLRLWRPVGSLSATN